MLRKRQDEKSKIALNNTTNIREKLSGKNFAVYDLISVPSSFSSASQGKYIFIGSNQKTLQKNKTAEVSVIPEKAFLIDATAAENIKAIELYFSQANTRFVRSELNGNTEIFYDKDGNIVKSNLLYNKNDKTQVYSTTIEFQQPQQNGVTSIAKSKNQIEIIVTKPVFETYNCLQMFDKGYKEFDLDGNIKREVYAKYGVYEKTPDTYEIRYNKNREKIFAKQEIRSKDGSKITTVIDYIKCTKRIEKADKYWNTYEFSETNINDTPNFTTKQDVMRNNEALWTEFPTIRQAISNPNFDCVSVQTIVETLKKQPDACLKIIKLKTTDGTPRFTREEAATLILNCRKFLDTPRLMKFITTPNTNGTKRDVYNIWRSYVNSNEFNEIKPAIIKETVISPVEKQVLSIMASPIAQNYTEKIVNTQGNENALTDLLLDAENLPDLPLNRAIKNGIKKCIMGAGHNTEHVGDFIKAELLKELSQEYVKETALASINKNAVLSDEVYAAAFELSQNTSASEKRHVAELMNNNAGLVEKIMTYKNIDGSQMFTPKLIAELFLNCESVIKSNPGKILAILESDSFKKNYGACINKSAALWKCLYC